MFLHLAFWAEGNHSASKQAAGNLMRDHDAAMPVSDDLFCCCSCSHRDVLEMRLMALMAMVG